jgi:hypothetical protein
MGVRPIPVMSSAQWNSFAIVAAHAEPSRSDMRRFDVMRGATWNRTRLGPNPRKIFRIKLPAPVRLQSFPAHREIAGKHQAATFSINKANSVRLLAPVF